MRNWLFEFFSVLRVAVSIWRQSFELGDPGKKLLLLILKLGNLGIVLARGVAV